MTKQVTIYHNPRCSKSCQTLALLREHGIEPDVVEYLKEPLTNTQVGTLIAQLGESPHSILRTKESLYREAGLSSASTSKEIAEAIVRHPILLERPIVVRGNKAVIGRPPENVMRLL